MIIEFNCETCGKAVRRSYSQNSIPKHFFCSRACQNVWQKTRQDIVEKNKDPEFRKKVSAGLKRRKQILKEDYHSPETKKKIGLATREHWESYTDDKKERLIKVLRNNGASKRTCGTYDTEWHKLSEELRDGAVCSRCGSTDYLHVHHIIPAKKGGSRDRSNLVVLCSRCHRIVESAQYELFNLLEDWELIRRIVKGRLSNTPYVKHKNSAADGSQPCNL